MAAQVVRSGADVAWMVTVLCHQRSMEVPMSPAPLTTQNSRYTNNFQIPKPPMSFIQSSHEVSIPTSARHARNNLMRRSSGNAPPSSWSTVRKAKEMETKLYKHVLDIRPFKGKRERDRKAAGLSHNTRQNRED